MTGEHSIQSRGLLVHYGFPVKAYPLARDFKEIYGSTLDALVEIAGIMDLNPHLASSQDPQKKALYAIAFPWGYVERGGPVRKVDFFPFVFDRDWSTCNPESIGEVFKDGVKVPDPVCEMGFMVLGREGFLRRSIAASGGDLQKYLDQWPELDYLGPVEDKVYLLTV